MDKKENVDFNKNESVATATIPDWSPVDNNGKHKNSAEIENDIEETRHSMDLILDALGGKSSPGALYNKAQSYLQNSTNRENIKNNLSKIGHSVSNSFQRNPLPVMMIATGVSWLFWETQRPTYKPEYEQKAGETIENIKDTSKENLNYVKQKTGEFSETAKQNFQNLSSLAKDKAKSFLGGARYKGKQFNEQASNLQDRAKHSFRKTDTTVHNNALLFGAAAAFAGIIAGILIPETSMEKRTAGEKSGEMLNKAETTEKQVVKDTNKTADEQGISQEQISGKSTEALQKTEHE